jgi:hypothetical protein
MPLNNVYVSKHEIDYRSEDSFRLISNKSEILLTTIVKFFLLEEMKCHVPITLTVMFLKIAVKKPYLERLVLLITAV